MALDRATDEASRPKRITKGSMMSLDYNLSKIANRESVCFVGEGDDRRLSNITNALIWMTLAVDIGEITEKTIDEFFVRLSIVERLHGASFIEDGKPHLISYAELQQHIGLRTNVGSGGTRYKWLKAKMDNMIRDAETYLYYDKRKIFEEAA